MAADKRLEWTPEAAHRNDLNNFGNVAMGARSLATAIRQFQAVLVPPQTASDMALNFSARLAIGDVGLAVVRLRQAMNPADPFKPLPPNTPHTPISVPSRVVGAQIAIGEALDRLLRDAGIEHLAFPEKLPLPDGEYMICMDNLTGLCQPGEHYYCYRDAQKLAKISEKDVDLLESQAAMLAAYVESEPARAKQRERDATIKPDHIRNDPETRGLLDAVAGHVRGHTRDFTAAFAWIIDRPVWRTPVAGFMETTADLLQGPALNDLPREQRMAQARKVLALAWLLSDPDAHTADGLPKELAACGWSTTAVGDDARNRCLARGVALDSPETWPRWVAMIQEATNLLHMARPAGGPAGAASPSPPAATPTPSRSDNAPTHRKHKAAQAQGPASPRVQPVPKRLTLRVDLDNPPPPAPGWGEEIKNCTIVDLVAMLREIATTYHLDRGKVAPTGYLSDLVHKAEYLAHRLHPQPSGEVNKDYVTISPLDPPPQSIGNQLRPGPDGAAEARLSHRLHVAQSLLRKFSDGVMLSRMKKMGFAWGIEGFLTDEKRDFAGRIEAAADELTEMGKAAAQPAGPVTGRTATGVKVTPMTETKEHSGDRNMEVPWNPDDANYLSAKEAVAAVNKMRPGFKHQDLSKVLQPDGPMHYMRNPNKDAKGPGSVQCKVHKSEFNIWCDGIKRLGTARSKQPKKPASRPDPDESQYQTGFAEGHSNGYAKGYEAVKEGRQAHNTPPYDDDPGDAYVHGQCEGWKKGYDEGWNDAKKGKTQRFGASE